MRKALAFLLVSSLLIIPLAAFADNSGVVGTEISFLDVVNLKLAATWPEYSILQASIANFFDNPGYIDIWDETQHPVHSPEIKVWVEALGQFHVYGGYWTSKSAKINDTGDFIALNDFVGLGHTGGALPIAFGQIAGLDAIYVPDPADGTTFSGTNIYPDGGYPGETTHLDPLPVASFTSLGWTGGNNMAAGGAVNSYDVLWKPSRLTGDFVAGEAFDLRIYILVDDPGT